MLSLPTTVPAVPITTTTTRAAPQHTGNNNINHLRRLGNPKFNTVPFFQFPFLLFCN